MTAFNEEPTKTEVRAAPLVTPTAADEHLAVDVDKIQADPDQPRKTFHESGIADLAASIKQNGLLQPIVVRPVDAGYVVVAGERRLRAVQKLGLKTIQCVVRHLSDIHTVRILQLVENEDREPLDMVELALSLRRDMEDSGVSRDELQKQLKWSRQRLSEYLSVAKAPDYVHRYAKEHKVKGTLLNDNGDPALDVSGKPQPHEYRLAPLSAKHIVLLARYDTRLRAIEKARKNNDGGGRALPFEKLVVKIGDKASLKEWSRRKLEKAIKDQVSALEGDGKSAPHDAESKQSESKARVSDTAASFSANDLSAMDGGQKKLFVTQLTALLSPHFQSVIIDP